MSDQLLSTVPGQPDARWLAVERKLRFFTFGLVTVLVGLGAVGWLGVRVGTSHASANGYTLEVVHAEATRAGLATPFSVRVSRADGGPLPEHLTIRVTSSYLALFDDNGLEPTPDESYNAGEWTWWSFPVPAGGRELRVDLDARLEPAVQWGQTASVALLVGGEEMVEVDFTTWVLP